MPPLGTAVSLLWMTYKSREAPAATACFSTVCEQTPPRRAVSVEPAPMLTGTLLSLQAPAFHRPVTLLLT